MLLAVALLGCGDDPVSTTTSDSPEPGLSSPWTGPMPSGTYLLNLAVVPLGGLAVPFQVEVTTSGAGVIDSLALRGVSLGGDVSEDLYSWGPLALDEDGHFALEADEILIPAAYTITGSDVTVELELDAEVGADGSFCGDVGGMITSMSLPLAGSTFGTSPWDGDLIGPTSCGAATGTTIPRITDCPTLAAGQNVGFPSGGLDRDVEIVVPAAYDPSVPTPVVFVFHGYGGDPGDMLDGAGLRAFADERGVILVAPTGLVSGGYTLWDVFGGEATNLDLVLFDDLLTCVSETWNVDPDRVHATGMSFGGLMTGALLAHRADVLASAAPISGGILTTFEATATPPVLVTWGGEIDEAVEQDFDLLAAGMIDTLTGHDQFVVGCNHGMGHVVLAEFWPWILDFLGDHPRGVSPEPYTGGLPESFPEYCVIE